jgi:DNA-binding NarL/FixJ family response regulator
VLYGTYSRGRAQRFDVPQEVEKARLLLELTQLGWGRENHAFLQVWASQFQPGGTLEHLRSWSEQQRAATSPEMAVRLLRIGFETDVRESALRVSCPTLIIHAERDAVVPIEEARVLAGLIPGSRFVQLDSENHMLLPSEPSWGRFLDEARRFLPHASARGGGHAARLPLSDLTPRERDILERIAQGLDNREIATALGLSEKTVRNHISRVFDKIGAQHRYQAIVRAREAGLGTASGLPSR